MSNYESLIRYFQEGGTPQQPQGNPSNDHMMQLMQQQQMEEQNEGQPQQPQQGQQQMSPQQMEQLKQMFMQLPKQVQQQILQLPEEQQPQAIQQAFQQMQAQGQGQPQEGQIPQQGAMPQPQNPMAEQMMACGGMNMRSKKNYPRADFGKDLGAFAYGAGSGVLNGMTMGMTKGLTDAGYKALQGNNNSQKDKEMQDMMMGFGNMAGGFAASGINPAAGLGGLKGLQGLGSFSAMANGGSISTNMSASVHSTPKFKKSYNEVMAAATGGEKTLESTMKSIPSSVKKLINSRALANGYDDPQRQRAIRTQMVNAYLGGDLEHYTKKQEGGYTDDSDIDDDMTMSRDAMVPQKQPQQRQEPSYQQEEPQSITADEFDYNGFMESLSPEQQQSIYAEISKYPEEEQEQALKQMIQSMSQQQEQMRYGGKNRRYSLPY